MVYGLGSNGAKELKQCFVIRADKADWTSKNHAVNRFYLEHTLAVADVMVALEIACRNSNQVRLVESDEFAFAKERWNVTVNHRGEGKTVGIIPDKIFALEFSNQSRETALIFLEADRATMPVVRQNLKKSSIFRKMLAYHESWRQKLHTSLFGHQRCVVLTVTTSPERIGKIIEANRVFNKGRGSGLFVIMDGKAVSACEDFMALPIRNGRGDMVTIADQLSHQPSQ
jgi:hypothetical protein